MKILKHFRSIKKNSLINKNDSPAVVEAKTILQDGFQDLKKEHLDSDGVTFPPGGIKVLVSNLIHNTSLALQRENLTIQEAIPTFSEELMKFNKSVTLKTLEVASNLAPDAGELQLFDIMQKAINSVQDFKLEDDEDIRREFDKAFALFGKHPQFGPTIAAYLDHRTLQLRENYGKIKSCDLECLIRISKILGQYVQQYPDILTEAFRTSFRNCFTLCNELYAQANKSDVEKERELHASWIAYINAVTTMIKRGEPITQEIADTLEGIYQYILDTPENNRAAISELITAYNSMKESHLCA